MCGLNCTLFLKYILSDSLFRQWYDGLYALLFVIFVGSKTIFTKNKPQNWTPNYLTKHLVTFSVTGYYQSYQIFYFFKLFICYSANKSDSTGIGCLYCIRPTLREGVKMWLGVEILPCFQTSTPTLNICGQSRFDDSTAASLWFRRVGGASASRFPLAYAIQWQSKPHPLFITFKHMRIYSEYSVRNKSDWSTFTVLSPIENQHRCGIVIRLWKNRNDPTRAKKTHVYSFLVTFLCIIISWNHTDLNNRKHAVYFTRK